MCVCIFFKCAHANLCEWPSVCECVSVCVSVCVCVCVSACVAMCDVCGHV